MIGRSLLPVLNARKKFFVSPLSIWETTAGLAKESKVPFEDAENLVREFVEEIGATVIHVDDEIGREALRASRLYGRGRHAASLNFGDCFAYACARVRQVPLLFKGFDFPKTDIERA